MGPEQQPRSMAAEKNPRARQIETFHILLPNKTKISIQGFMQTQILSLLIERARKNKPLESKDLLDLFDAGIPYPKRRQRVRMSITNLRKKLAEHDLTIYAMEQNGSLASYRLGKKGLTKLEVKSLFSQNGALEPKPQENQKPELEPAQNQENQKNGKHFTLPIPKEGTLVDFSLESPPADLASPGSGQYPASQGEALQGQKKVVENSPFVLPDGKKTPKSRGKQREFLRLLIAAKNEGRDFSEQDLRIMYPDIHTPLYAWKKLSKTAVLVRPGIRDLGWNIEFKISKDGTKKTYELNQSVEPSGSNSIPIIFPDGKEGPKTWGRVRKILETLIEAHKKGVIFSKREIWQKVCPEIPFEKASYEISKAIGDNLKSILLNTQWQIETVQASQNEPVTYALTKKDETNEKPIPNGEIPVSVNDRKPIENSAAVQEPVVAPTLPKEPPEKGTIVDFSGNGNGASPKRELPEREYHVAYKSKEAERIAKSIAYEILAHLADGVLHRIPTSHIKILQSALDGKGIRDVFGITTKAELDEYFISFIMEKLEKLWDTTGGRSLSIEELRIQGGLATLRETNYTKEKIEEVLRLHFSIPAPTPAAAARAN